jgi:hypothetical protein
MGSLPPPSLPAASTSPTAGYRPSRSRGPFVGFESPVPAPRISPAWLCGSALEMCWFASGERLRARHGSRPAGTKLPLPSGLATNRTRPQRSGTKLAGKENGPHENYGGPGADVQDHQTEKACTRGKEPHVRSALPMGGRWGLRPLAAPPARGSPGRPEEGQPFDPKPPGKRGATMWPTLPFGFRDPGSLGVAVAESAGPDFGATAVQVLAPSPPCRISPGNG